MKTIDAVILRGTIMPWSLLIMLATWHWSSHAMLEVSDGDIMEAVATGIEKRKHHKPWYAWEARYSLGFLSVAARQQMYRRAMDRMERSHGYDWRYYLAYMFNMPRYQVASRDVCYEFVYHVIRPWVVINKNPARVVGRHIARVMEGLHDKYRNQTRLPG